MDQNEKGSPYTIDELIGVLEQQKRSLGGDYFPRIRMGETEYLIEEVDTNAGPGSEPVVHLCANTYDVAAETARLAEYRAAEEVEA